MASTCRWLRMSNFLERLIQRQYHSLPTVKRRPAAPFASAHESATLAEPNRPVPMPEQPAVNLEDAAAARPAVTDGPVPPDRTGVPKAAPWVEQYSTHPIVDQDKRQAQPAEAQFRAQPQAHSAERIQAENRGRTRELPEQRQPGAQTSAAAVPRSVVTPHAGQPAAADDLPMPWQEPVNAQLLVETSRNSRYARLPNVAPPPLRPVAKDPGMRMEQPPSGGSIESEAPVQVTIGKIEITAVTAPPAQQRTAASRKSAQSLQDYLARRRGGSA